MQPIPAETLIEMLETVLPKIVEFTQTFLKDWEDGIIDMGDSNVVVRSGKLVGKNVERKKYPDLPVISAEEAFDRMGKVNSFNMGQMKIAMNQAIVESSQFFRLTIFSCCIGFAMIIFGILLIFLELMTVGVVSSIAGLVPEVIAAIFFKKDKELRGVIRSYEEKRNESQKLLTLINTAQTIDNDEIRDNVKREIIRSTLARIKPTSSQG